MEQSERLHLEGMGKENAAALQGLSEGHGRCDKLSILAGLLMISKPVTGCMHFGSGRRN